MYVLLYFTGIVVFVSLFIIYRCIRQYLKRRDLVWVGRSILFTAGISLIEVTIAAFFQFALDPPDFLEDRAIAAVFIAGPLIAMFGFVLILSGIALSRDKIFRVLDFLVQFRRWRQIK